MKIEPEGSRLLVILDAVEEKTAGGIYRPPTAKEREQLASTTAVIVSIGPATMVEFNGEALKDGDHIMIAKYAGFQVKDVDTEIDYRIINDEDVIARIS